MNLSSCGAVFRWQPAAWLRVAGPDAASFLQGQFTQDLRAIGPGEARYGLWLNVKGKVVADSFVIGGSQPDEFWIGSYHSPAAAIRERLESFIIADDVSIEDQTAQWRGCTVFEPDGRPASPKGTFVFSGRRGPAAVEMVGREDNFAALVASVGSLPEIDAVEVARRRIRAGIPAIPVDIGPGDLPNEGGLETDALSYVKGCYLGQEVMARLKSMGQVRRKLLRVRGSVSVPVRLPAPLFVGARQVGELRSAVDDSGRTIGLAMLGLLHVQPETPLALAADSSGVLTIEAGP